MEISDYSQRLAQTKSDFRDKAKELRENYKDEVKNVKEMAQHKLDKQSDNFSRAKTKMDEDAKSNVDFYNKKTADVIKERTDEYRKNLNSKRGDFEKQRVRQKESFDDRLSYLRDNYNNKAQSRQHAYNRKLEQATDLFDSLSKRNKTDFDNAVSDMDQRSKKSIDDMKNDLSREKKNIFRSNDEQLSEMASSGAISRNKMQGKFQRDLASLRETQDGELKQRDEHHKKRLSDVAHAKTNENQKLQRNFAQHTENLTRKNNDERLALTRNNKQEMKRNERKFANDLQRFKRESDEKVKGGDSEGRINDEKERMSNTYGKRIKNLTSTLNDERHRNQIDKEKMEMSFDDSLQDQKFKSSKNLSDQEEILLRNQKDYMNKMAKRSANAIGNYRQELLKTRLESEQKSVRQRQHAKKILDNQRESFSNVVKTLEQKNSEAISKVQDQHSKDQSKFIEQTKHRHYKNMEELRGDLKSAANKKEHSLIERLDAKEREMQDVIMNYEARLARMKKKAADEIIAMKELHAQQNESAQEDMKMALDSTIQKNNLEKISLKGQYEKRLADTKNYNDMQVAKLVERYESQLTRERNDLVKEMKVKLKEAEKNYRKLYEQSEMEKELLRNQFEMKFETIRQSNAKALDESLRETRQDS